MEKPSTPARRRQKPGSSNRAFVELDGRRSYLGRYDTPESRAAYARLLAERATDDTHAPISKEQLTIAELCARFWEHALRYYVLPDGTHTSEVYCFKQVLSILEQTYGLKRVSEFGPLALTAVRQGMIEKGWVRTAINSHICRFKLIFKWGVAEELVEASVYEALCAVSGLKRGHCNVPEPEPVKPIPNAHVIAVRPYVSRQVWALIQLQLLTAAHSGELVRMRPIDLNMSVPVWAYRPEQNKIADRGHERRIYVGPRAQKILRPFLAECPINAFIFNPQQAENERLAAKHAARKTPLGRGNAPGTNKVLAPKRKPGEYYTRDGYRRAIARACKKAGIPTWHPHQLRHNAGSRLRVVFGWEAAQTILGHSHAETTQIYVEANELKAIEIAQKIG